MKWQCVLIIFSDYGASMVGKGGIDASSAGEVID